MKILIVGDDPAVGECQQKFGNDHDYRFYSDRQALEDDDVNTCDVTFDFSIDEAPEEFEIYGKVTKPIFLNTVKMSLSELNFLSNVNERSIIFGFNGLPTMFNRQSLEISMHQKSDEQTLTTLCSQLKTDYVVVDDRVGMVTPRVICMIINEAYYTVQEKTASREDIDIAMKLGTNYPYGPFEWAKKIGIKHVFETLEAVFEDTKDERYKICPLLKKEYLSSAPR